MPYLRRTLCIWVEKGVHSGMRTRRTTYPSFLTCASETSSQIFFVPSFFVKKKRSRALCTTSCHLIIAGWYHSQAIHSTVLASLLLPRTVIWCDHNGHSPPTTTTLSCLLQVNQHGDRRYTKTVCKHTACTDCLAGWIEAQISCGNTTILCPMPGQRHR